MLRKGALMPPILPPLRKGHTGPSFMNGKEINFFLFCVLFIYISCMKQLCKNILV